MKRQQEGGLLQATDRDPEEPNPASTLILDCWPPELRENEFLLFKPPIMWYFVFHRRLIHKHLVEKNTNSTQSHLKTKGEERTLPNSFCEANIILMPTF